MISTLRFYWTTSNSAVAVLYCNEVAYVNIIIYLEFKSHNLRYDLARNLKQTIYKHTTCIDSVRYSLSSDFGCATVPYPKRTVLFPGYLVIYVDVAIL